MMQTLKRNWLPILLIVGTLWAFGAFLFAEEPTSSSESSSLSIVATPVVVPQGTSASIHPSVSSAAPVSGSISGWVIALFVLGLIVLSLMWLSILAFVVWKRRLERKAREELHVPEMSQVAVMNVAGGAAMLAGPPMTSLRRPRRALPPPRQDRPQERSQVIEGEVVIETAPLAPPKPEPKPWAQLTPQETLHLQQQCGWNPTSDMFLSGAPKRILELQAKFGAHTALVAPDYSLVVFPNIMLPLGDIQKKASPQPAVLTANGAGEPRVVVGLFLAPAAVVAPVAPKAAEIVAPVAPVQPPAPLSSREATLAMQDQLSAARPTIPVPQLDRIPFLFNGKHWGTLSLRHSAPNGGDYVICGAKRWGKGNAAQLIALQVLMLGPNVAEVWILDPKSGLDYDFALKLQHTRLYVGGKSEQLISDGDLSDGYKAALDEMNRRNAVMQAAHLATGKTIRNIEEYNAICDPKERLPYIALICDEVADLEKDQRSMLATLSRMAGASGIVLYALTQYPTVEALSSQVQANITNRLVLRLASSQEAKVALRLGSGEQSRFDPAAITSKGVAVLRRDGKEHIGRVPEVYAELRQTWITQLISRWPRAAQSTPLIDVPATEQPNLADLQAKLQGALAEIEALKATRVVQATPEVVAAESDDVALSPYELLDATRKAGKKQAVLRDHPVVIAAVRAAYDAIPEAERSARAITMRVFDSQPGARDGWSGNRQNDIVQPILDQLGLVLATRSAVPLPVLSEHGEGIKNPTANAA